ncbi:hypothetical protein [Escherichia phage pEC-N1203-2Af.1]|nr:hypothetical protein [Escherichia phage pEC-N1203-2Af.1]
MVMVQQPSTSTKISNERALSVKSSMKTPA